MRIHLPIRMLHVYSLKLPTHSRATLNSSHSSLIHSLAAEDIQEIQPNSLKNTLSNLQNLLILSSILQAREPNQKVSKLHPCLSRTQVSNPSNCSSSFLSCDLRPRKPPRRRTILSSLLTHSYVSLFLSRSPSKGSSNLDSPQALASSRILLPNTKLVMAIEVGDKVEVIGFEPGFKHSYFAGKVIRNYNDAFEVQYEDLVVTKGGEQIIEMIDAVHVRPYPPYIDYNIDHFEKGDVVDVFYNDEWWDGVIQDVFYNMNNQKRYEVFFDYMWGQKRYESYKPEKVRPHQFWVVVNNERMWIPAARVKMEEEVEITGERR
ncbi:hypothetical protein LXL04_034210 [Taraxacum kok-saghyz]